VTLSIFRVKSSTSNKIVILRTCDFIDLSCEILDLKQNRHPERSASQIYRVAERVVARSRRTPAALILPILLGAFHHRCLYGADPPRSFLGAENQEPARILLGPACTNLVMKMITVHEKMFLWPSSAYRSRSCFRASVAEKLRAAWVR
jgi:hypothetical protein